jgi:2-phospho-L-lactate guanylyltransferase
LVATEGQSTERTTWCLVVPVKLLHLAKSRLSSDPAERSALALAFAADTVAAALRAPSVVEVVVVTDDATAARLVRGLGAEVVPDEPDAGLNPALRHGARHAAARHPGCGVGALSADLPALRPRELEEAVLRASVAGIAVVPDTGGSGTTAYFVADASRFAPAFGTDSLQAHVAAGAVALEGLDLASLRRDVDTQADLAAAIVLGVGNHTAAALEKRI